MSDLKIELIDGYEVASKTYPVCRDCYLPYTKFGLDTTLPDEQWLLIHPEGLGGLLCANCIARRAEKLKGSIAIRATIEGVE